MRSATASRHRILKVITLPTQPSQWCWHLPTASELSFPKNAAVGYDARTLTLSAKYVSLHSAYQHHTANLLHSSIVQMLLQLSQELLHSQPRSVRLWGSGWWWFNIILYSESWEASVSRKQSQQESPKVTCCFMYFIVPWCIMGFEWSSFDTHRTAASLVICWPYE